MKVKRHNKILEIIENYNIETQEELIAKLKLAGWIYKFETHNGFTKNDLVAVIRWLIDQNYHWAPEGKK